MKSVRDEPAPPVLLPAVLQDIFYSRIYRSLSIIFGLVVLSLVVSVWHFYARMIELDSFRIIKLAVSTFEFDATSAQESISFASSFMPLGAAAVVLANIIVLIAMRYSIRTVRRSYLTMSGVKRA